MSAINAMNFTTSELYELNILVVDLKSVVNFNGIVSWLKPTKTYADCNYNINTYPNYEHVLENIIDRVYLVLNIVLMKLEEFTDMRRKNLRRPKRLTISSLSRIIIENLSAFNLLQKKKQFITRDVGSQTNFPQQVIQDGDCRSCIILFKQLHSITDMFGNCISLTNIKNARYKVINNLFVLNNSQSMSIMCDAIHEDLRLFLDDYRALNESHASLQQQYDKLMNDFINYMAECDANFVQNEDALKTLTNNVDVLREGFASELQLLSESSAAISEANRIQRENEQRINALQKKSLQFLARHLEMFNALESNVAQQIVNSIDICAQKLTLLQSRLRMLQLNASDLKACTNTMNEVHEIGVSKEHCGPLAGNNPVEDMLQHIESNKLKIDYLQGENVALQRTIEQIKMRVTY